MHGASDNVTAVSIACLVATQSAGADALHGCTATVLKASQDASKIMQCSVASIKVTHRLLQMRHQHNMQERMKVNTLNL